MHPYKFAGIPVSMTMLSSVGVAAASGLGTLFGAYFVQAY